MDRDARDELVEVVYRVNNPRYGDYCSHEETASAILAAGYRRVSDDEATVERVARAIADSARPGNWERADLATRDDLRDEARAAIRSLREEADHA